MCGRACVFRELARSQTGFRIWERNRTTDRQTKKTEPNEARGLEEKITFANVVRKKQTPGAASWAGHTENESQSRAIASALFGGDLKNKHRGRFSSLPPVRVISDQQTDAPFPGSARPGLTALCGCPLLAGRAQQPGSKLPSLVHRGIISSTKHRKLRPRLPVSPFMTKACSCERIVCCFQLYWLILIHWDFTF